MLVQRLIVAIVLIPIGIFFISMGGWVFAVAAALVFGYAAFEFWRLFNKGGYRPSAAVMVAGVAALVLSEQLSWPPAAEVIITLVVLLAITVQIVLYEKGSDTASIDFSITIGGFLYLGWLGSYFVALRNLPQGLWWLLVVLPATWIADAAAMFVGTRFGKHKMSPRVSPNKSWEGYIGGVVFGALGAALLAALWSLRAPEVTPLKGLLFGMIIAAVSPLGDLGESMLKRVFGEKDSGHVLPGHGGVLDRIDSWLWAACIGYYLVLLAP